MKTCPSALSGLFVLCLAVPLFAIDWPQFRGGSAMSLAPQVQVPGEWNSQNHLAWRTPLPGSGWSQPVVVGQKVFVTTAVSEQAKRPKGMLAGAIDPSTMGKARAPSESWQGRVICLDLQSGKVVWDRLAFEGTPPFAKHASNTYATETPAASPTRLFAFFGAVGTLVCYDHDGQEQWRKDLGAQEITNQFGTGSSPVLYESNLLVQLYNEKSAELVCLDPENGQLRWRAEGSKGTSWSTPIVWNNQGTTEVVTAGTGMVIAYDLATGKETWRVGGLDTSFSGSLVADSDTVYAGTASPGSRAPLYAIAAGNHGDLTLPAGKTSSPAIRWSKNKSGAGMPSPVVIGDFLYFFGSTVTCYDKRTGEEKYRKRMPGGTMAAGCPIVVQDRIYLVNERGMTVVLQAGPDFQVLGEYRLEAPDEVFWATPAVADNAFLIRSSDAIYCIR